MSAGVNNRSAIAIGSELFRHEQYRRSDPWASRWVVGETRVSWIIGRAPDTKPDDSWGTEKLKKSEVRDESKRLYGWAFSRKEIADGEWISNNQYSLGDAVRRCDDIEKLRQIAALIGYQEKTK